MDAMVCAAAVASALASSKIFTVRLSSDRKSTRLNSSHGYISYAVFCLKKKKKHFRSERSFSYARPVPRGSRQHDTQGGVFATALRGVVSEVRFRVSSRLTL